jgi:hypothetical protein
MKKEWSYAALALAAGLLGGIIGGRWSNGAPASAAEAPAKSIEARRITLVGAKGNALAALYTNKDGEPSFDLYDHTGKLRAGFAIGGDQFLGLKLYDAKGVERITMTVNSDGIPALRIFDSEATPRTLLGVDSDGEPALDFYSRQGKLLRELP